MSTMAVLDKTVCLQLSASLWSGRRRLRAEDLGSAADSLPPGDLASLGSLKLCDPKRLARLGNIKRAAERDLRRVCVQFLGGYATDADNVSALVSKLTSHQQRFESEARAFANGLQKEIDHGREMYNQQVPVSAGSRDYFHEELVRILTENDASLLGEAYPGPMNS